MSSWMNSSTDKSSNQSNDQGLHTSNISTMTIIKKARRIPQETTLKQSLGKIMAHAHASSKCKLRVGTDAGAAAGRSVPIVTSVKQVQRFGVPLWKGKHKLNHAASSN
jgi:hypothetical protein